MSRTRDFTRKQIILQNVQYTAVWDFIILNSYLSYLSLHTMGSRGEKEQLNK